jgi:hypothetical protein
MIHNEPQIFRLQIMYRPLRPGLSFAGETFAQKKLPPVLIWNKGLPINLVTKHYSVAGTFDLDNC